ncbi:alpha-hydroxy acid oxidase [Magnetospirillum sp. XM-1]|uniref:alpha-hydroxy acid oxidase n=1 Tax=Magnetospirillum sp. XM-1 TaxID=1663591 RepID=UPI000838B850|nr:alpha-hydroxy acid oxidase [Magnetospirillum sp. XM-1]
MLVNIEDHRRRAKRHLPRFVFDYVEGGADDESCLRRNRADMEGVSLIPTCLRDVSTIDVSTEILGRRWRAPIAIAPTGFNGLLRPDGDIMAARAAAAAGIPFCLSTASNTRMERLPDDGGERWLQLYVMTDRAIAEQMLDRAHRAGFTTLVLTVDVPTGGNRERDRRNGFRLPFRPSVSTLLDLCRRPAWLAGLARSGPPRFCNLSRDESDGQSVELQATLLNRALDRRLAWDDLAWLRRRWDGAIVIKGLLNPEDAAQAVRFGADGIIVSNHGGRQLDAAPSTISILPAMVAAVAGRIPVLVDSGFRRGSDVVKALALGAAGILLGRPVLYGLAGGGEAGVRAVLETIIAEIETTMTLVGAATLADIGPQHLVRPS